MNSNLNYNLIVYTKPVNLTLFSTPQGNSSTKNENNNIVHQRVRNINFKTAKYKFEILPSHVKGNEISGIVIILNDIYPQIHQILNEENHFMAILVSTHYLYSFPNHIQPN